MYCDLVWVRVVVWPALSFPAKNRKFQLGVLSKSTTSLGLIDTNIC